MDKSTTLSAKLSQAKNAEMNSIAEFLSKKTDSQEINLSLMIIDEKDFDALCEFLENPDVAPQHLDISGNNLASCNMARLFAALSKKTTLQNLNLSNTKLSLDGMRDLGEYLQNPQTNLKNLEFRLNTPSVKQSASSFFAALAQNKKLEFLSLSASLHNDSAGAFAKYLVENLYIKKVTFNNSGFDQKAMEKIRDAFLVNDLGRVQLRTILEKKLTQQQGDQSQIETKLTELSSIERTTDFKDLTNKIDYEKSAKMAEGAQKIVDQQVNKNPSLYQDVKVEKPVESKAKNPRTLPKIPSDRKPQPLSPYKVVPKIGDSASPTTPPASPTKPRAESPVTPTKSGTKDGPVHSV